jgi:acetyltransferase EpsM
MNCYSAVTFVDDAYTAAPTDMDNYACAGTLEELLRLKEVGYTHFLVSIGSNQTRARCYAEALQSGLAPATIVHPRAVIAPSAGVGTGTVVMAAAVVNPDARIGDNCIVNTAAVVEHDCQIGNHVHISPGAILAGGVSVGTHAHIGAGATVLPGIQIGEGAIVGAGAVVLREVPAWGTVVGVPAKLIRAKQDSKVPNTKISQ